MEETEEEGEGEPCLTLENPNIPQHCLSLPPYRVLTLVSPREENPPIRSDSSAFARGRERDSGLNPGGDEGDVTSNR